MRPVDIAGLLKNIDAATNDISIYEAARFHEQRWKEHGARLLELGARSFRVEFVNESADDILTHGVQG